MSQRHKETVRKYIAATASRDWNTMHSCLAAAWRQHNPDGSTVDRGNDVAQISTIYEGFPDLRPTIHQQIAEGDTVVTHLTWRGTHTGAFADIPPTNRRADFEVIRIDRFDRGAIAETRVMYDSGAARRQLGEEA